MLTQTIFVLFKIRLIQSYWLSADLFLRDPYYTHRKHVRDFPGVSDVLRDVMFTS